MPDGNGQKHLERQFAPPARILAIDDSPLNRQFISSTFNSPEYELALAKSGAEGIQAARERKPEVILLDVMMPEEDGFDICGKLKSSPDTSSIPIIFFTAVDSIEEKLRGFDMGAADFITKPFNYRELIARVRTQISLSRAMSEKEKMLHVAMEERRNAVIARIAGGISHNFSNLLVVSIGNLMLLESILGSDIKPSAREVLKDLRSGLERQKTLIRQFLRLSNRGFNVLPEPADIEFGPLLDEVIENVLMQEKDSGKAQPVRLQKTIPDGTLIHCDPFHAKEIFHLLISEIVSSAANPVTFMIASKSKGGTVACIFDVRGFGVAQEIRDSIFEPFALPLANVGTGLAFSVAKNLIELNKGRIVAEFPDEKNLLLNLLFLAGK